MKNLIPIIHCSRDKVIILWCSVISWQKYDARWMGKSGSNITHQATCDICEKQEEFVSLNDAKEAIKQYYNNPE